QRLSWFRSECLSETDEKAKPDHGMLEAGSADPLANPALACSTVPRTLRARPEPLWTERKDPAACAKSGVTLPTCMSGSIRWKRAADKRWDCEPSQGVKRRLGSAGEARSAIGKSPRAHALPDLLLNCLI